MKTARKNERIIKLDTLIREEFQAIYEHGKQGKLHCPECGENVRLYLGISNEPFFYHEKLSNKVCKVAEIDVPIVREEAAAIEKNGFSLPQSKSISAVQERPKTSFKKAKQLTSLPTYIPHPHHQHDHESPYLQELSDNGVQLDQMQATAVINTSGPLLVLAGAGSGKTRVLTARTAFMIIEEKINPAAIMLVTFTAKAAAEMKERLLQYPGLSQTTIQRIVSGTFHSIFFRILHFHFPEKWAQSRLLSKGWQREQIVKAAGKEMNLDEKEFAYDLALQQISFWKNALLTPHEVKAENPWEEKVQILFKEYEKEKDKLGMFDFDDMLLGCYEAFLKYPEILENYQKRFTHFLIDEFQDINKVQFELMKLLSAQTKNICAVGDDDQSIYAFRGSNPSYLVYFETEFPQTTVIKLEQNYRSAHEITAAANKVIIHNKKRRDKKMIAQYKADAAPIIFYPYDEEEEATMIVTDLQEKLKEGFNPNDFAILFRTHTGSRAIFERLAESSLPFKLDQDAESFYDRYIIKTMIAFLRIAINEEDPAALKQLLPAFFMKHTVLQDMKADSILNDRTLLECLSHLKTGFAFQESKLKKAVPLIRSLRGLSPLAAMEKVEKDLGLNDFIKKRGNEGNKMEKGSDDIRDLKVAARNFLTIHDFVSHVDHMRAMTKEIKQQSKKQQNAITLSTIHRSKGLEYKAVYIIGAVDGSIPHDHALEDYRSGNFDALEEERRLMYVAMTRAKSYLFMSTPQKRRGKKAYASRFLSTLIKS
ncbi:UvrD-helicase domain-containing protein [Cytobacillus purgationiresistens]|uniref:DNA 3'-5' helicase n=1 Tax=Cytobacillus purgationiresistens TaxID=863449 RepID=A0ABU0AD19_9BACI|nr:ATP-dependent helicase [Cytobacillus purgationiresistens]MDQ0268702.1 DNA helicase-2/ATP-dependent DNA helicase PcrA [Cytobacillus purgationiresistens]